MSLVEVQRLGLGTAQFGMDYGISNLTGRASDAEMTAILTRCRDAGISTLDTAALYDDAEKRIGDMLPDDWSPRIVTKTAHLAEGLAGVEQAFLASLERLGRESIYGLQVHRAGDLLGDEGPDLWRLLERLREEGRVEKIGVSVYSAEQTDSLLGSYPLEIVQFPASILDQRLVHDGTVGRLKKAGIEIHVRSIFLQGLLFLTSDQLPSELAFARTTLERVHACLMEAGITPLEAALAYVLQRPEFDIVLVGVTTQGELDAILNAALSPQPDLDWNCFALEDEHILNPAQWMAQ